MPDKSKGRGTSIDLLGDDVRLFVFLHMRDILNTGFVSL